MKTYYIVSEKVTYKLDCVILSWECQMSLGSITKAINVRLLRTCDFVFGFYNFTRTP